MAQSNCTCDLPQWECTNTKCGVMRASRDAQIRAVKSSDLPNPKKIAKIAALLIERDGWRRGSFGIINPEVQCERCIDGALRTADIVVTGIDAISNSSKDYRRLRHMLRHHLTTTGLWDWNDTEAQSKDEVLELLEQAAS